MNCKQAHEMLDDYLDGSLSTMQFSSLHSHLNSCDACQKDFYQAQNLVIALKDIPVPPAKTGFENRVLSFLDKEPTQKTSRHTWLIAGLSSAMAATLTMWLSISSFNISPENIDHISTVNLVASQTQKVDLIFNLPKVLSNATLTIELPEQLEVAGYPGKRQLQWNTSFKKGANRLALPLISTDTNNNSGLLLAHLTKNGKTKIFRIRINTKSANTSSVTEKQLTINS